MFNKLTNIAKRFEEISQQLYDPTVTTQPELYSALMKEYNNLKPLAEAHTTYNRLQKQLEEAQAVLAEAGGDKELHQMAQQEYTETKTALEALAEESRIVAMSFCEPRSWHNNLSS